MPAKLTFKFSVRTHILLIILIGLIAYFNCLSGEFIWDDFGLIKGNTYLRSLSGLPKIFSGNIWAGIGVPSRAYRPLQILTYFFDYSVWKLNPFGYHLSSVVLHILAGIILYWLLRLIFNQGFLAFVASSLFVSHPVQTEAVAYISGRADPLAAVFIFLSFGLYLKFQQNNKAPYFLAALLSFILALLSRENAIVLPVLLLAYHFIFGLKQKIKSCQAFFLIAAVYLIFRLALMNTVFSDAPVPTTFWQRLPGVFAALTNYLKILIIPADLHMEYGGALFKFCSVKVITGLGILSLFLAGIFKCRRSMPLISFGLSWFLIALIPASNLYPLNAYMAEHWLYLPAVGLFIILAKFFANLAQEDNFRRRAVILLVCLIGIYTVLTIKQNTYWRSRLEFFERTLKYAPYSARVYYHLGNVYTDLKDNVRGIAMYQEAIRLDPEYADAYNNIGNAYIEMGQNEEAIRYCRLALDLNPQLPEAYYNLGSAYYNLGQKEESLAMLAKSIELRPVYLEAYNNLAAGYAQAGNLDEAIRLWNKSLAVDPTFKVAHFNLAKFYFAQKKYAPAIWHCDRIKALGAEVDPAFLKLLEPFRK